MAKTLFKTLLASHFWHPAGQSKVSEPRGGKLHPAHSGIVLKSYMAKTDTVRRDETIGTVHHTHFKEFTHGNMLTR